MSWLERHWARITPLSFLLLPVSVLFRAAVALRRSLYRSGILPVRKLPVPVIVVGNISVGGTGKTPVVLWLVQFLEERGFHPGIVSRGHGGKTSSSREVTGTSDPAACGDEPVMLAQRGRVPVWVGADRPDAATGLLAAHPECDVIVCDDGLQHYALGRNVEIAVVDGARGLGNGHMLPAGPLREPPARLATVDALVVNVSEAAGVGLQASAPPAYALALHDRGFHNLLNPGHIAGPESFRNQRVHAVAGIGHPQRFFAQLRRLGLTFTAHPFPDHHAYTASDLAFDAADAIVMTEKDAVKCRRYANEKHWALRVDAEIDSALGELVLTRLAR